MVGDVNPWTSVNFTGQKLEKLETRKLENFEFRVLNFTNFTNSIFSLNKIFILIKFLYWKHLKKTSL
jgi:hypothetical protein